MTMCYGIYTSYFSQIAKSQEFTVTPPCFVNFPYLLRCKLIEITKYLKNFPEIYFSKVRCTVKLMLFSVVVAVHHSWIMMTFARKH